MKPLSTIGGRLLEPHRLPVGQPLTGHTDWVKAVCPVPSPTGRTLLATGSDDRSVRLWDPTNGEELIRLVAGGPVYAICTDASDPVAGTFLAFSGPAGVGVVDIDQPRESAS